MRKTELNDKINQAMATRGHFFMDVPRGTRYGKATLRYEVVPHTNPALRAQGCILYSVSGMGETWDYSVNKNFDTREQFITSLYRRLSKEGK